MQITREDIARAVGGADDVTIAQIIGTGATGVIYFSSDVENAIYRVTRK